MEKTDTFRKKIPFFVAVFGIVVAMWCFAFDDLPVAYADECPTGGNHSYRVEILQYAEELTDGSRLFTCTKCGYTYEQIIPATGHHWGPWIIDVAPTCTSPGHEHRVCEQYPGSPHYEERDILPLSATGDHQYALIEELAPTCTDPGFHLYACSICGETYQEEIPAVSHEWSEWTVEEEPTSTKEGRKKRTCLHDETHVEYETIPALGIAEEVATKKTPVEKSKVSSPEEIPESSSGFFSGPNTFDAAVFAVDLGILGIFIIVAIPLIYQMRWVKRKRKEARTLFLAQVREEGKGK